MWTTPTTVSVIDGARCDSLTTPAVMAACARVETGSGAGGLAVDAEDHTVFALNGNDDTLSSIDSATCNGAAPGTCPKVAPCAARGPRGRPRQL